MKGILLDIFQMESTQRKYVTHCENKMTNKHKYQNTNSIYYSISRVFTHKNTMGSMCTIKILPAKFYQNNLHNSTMVYLQQLLEILHLNYWPLWDVDVILSQQFSNLIKHRFLG